MKKNLTQTPEQIESLNKHIEARIKEIKEEESIKKSMSVDSMTFLINYGDYVYKLTVFPLGKGLYNVGCYESKDGKNTKSAYIQDHFSHSMSMNKAKNILLIFLNHWDK